MEIFVIQNIETGNIQYVGIDVDEANSHLENPYLVKKEANKTQMSIWEDGRLLNEAITRKIRQ